MPNILAVYGSPRREGNTALLLNRAVEGARENGADVQEVWLPELLNRAVEGARENGADVQEVWLSDLNMSPCLEIYGCKRNGRCVIQDDFQALYDRLLACDGLMLASPIFFYAVSAHTKILMDRCQSLWVKKYWIEKAAVGQGLPKRKGIFISVGATNGKRLFDGALLSMRYFFDPLDMELWKTLLYRGLDFEGDVLKHPDFLEEAYEAGKCLCEAISMRSSK